MMLVLAVVICFISGIFSGLLGIGGGLILVPLFHYVLKMNMHLAIGTSLALIVPTALIGAFRYAGQSYVDWRIFFFAALFGVLGAFLGAGISMQMDVIMLKRVFAIFLVVVAIKMFVR